MNTLLFATGNERKLFEAQLACQDFGIELEQVQLKIDEIQSHDPLAIAKHKAAEAFRQINQPVVVTDTSWNIPALGGFPGGYMKDVTAWFAPEDFISLVKTKTDKRIGFTETITYQDGAQTKLFSETYWGNITSQPRGHGPSIEQVAEFNGYTIAERQNQGRTSHEPKEYVWYQFGEWFSNFVN
ncbi:MAG TPA: non-canonical purine NTP pyrophosphatase [Candidatus Acidoferrum sp.]|nr:non-canonical purine NTP pyrophosphatase [Candidatus Acidoferrum sp.]